jgi:hypothetical protein
VFVVKKKPTATTTTTTITTTKIGRRMKGGHGCGRRRMY